MFGRVMELVVNEVSHYVGYLFRFHIHQLKYCLRYISIGHWHEHFKEKS